MKEEDRNKRLESRELTRLRRQSQDCKCYTLKIDESHLNSVQRNFLHMSFLEAKWFYNYALSQTNIFDSSIRKVNSVVVKKLEEFEERELKYISSQMKTGLHERIGSAIKMLSTKKKQGYFDKVGRLKFKKRS